MLKLKYLAGNNPIWGIWGLIRYDSGTLPVLATCVAASVAWMLCLRRQCLVLIQALHRYRQFVPWGVLFIQLNERNPGYMLYFNTYFEITYNKLLCWNRTTLNPDGPYRLGCYSYYNGTKQKYLLACPANTQNVPQFGLKLETQLYEVGLDSNRGQRTAVNMAIIFAHTARQMVKGIFFQHYWWQLIIS